MACYSQVQKSVMGSMCYIPFLCMKDVICTQGKGVSSWKTRREKRELCACLLFLIYTLYFWGLSGAEKEQILCRDCAHSTEEFALPSSFWFLSINNLFSRFLISGAVKLLTSALLPLVKKLPYFIFGMIHITPRVLKLHYASYTCSNTAFIHLSAVSNETRRMEGGL